MAYQDPKRYEFTEKAREDYANTFWRMPLHICHNHENTLVRLWTANPSTTSLLPVLAMDAFPGRKIDDLERDLGAIGKAFPPSDLPSVCGPGSHEYTTTDAAPCWTKWVCSSIRRMAALSGLSKDSVITALRAMERLELVQTYKGPRGAYGGGKKGYYRLSLSTFFPFDNQEFARFPAKLLQHGHWAMLPTNASRHLYLVFTVLDAVRDEDAFLAAASASREDWGGNASSDVDDPQTREKILERARRKAPLSTADLERKSGLRHSTVVEARDVLLSPIFHEQRGVGREPGIGIAMVRTGASSAGKEIRWYAPDRRSWRWHFHVDFLNGSIEERERERRRNWPSLYAKRDREKLAARRRKKSRARRVAGTRSGAARPLALAAGAA